MRDHSGQSDGIMRNSPRKMDWNPAVEVFNRQRTALKNFEQSHNIKTLQEGYYGNSY